MSRRQYFVIVVMALGCAKNPAPDDSYFISIEDYNRVSVDTVTSQLILPDTTSVLPDTVTAADSTVSDSLEALPDSLSLIPDSLMFPEDSLPADTIEIPSEMDSWKVARLEIRGSLYQTLGILSDVDPDILGAHCVRYLVWEMNPWNGFIAGDSLTILYDTSPAERENMVMAFRYVPVCGSSNQSFAGYVYKRAGDNWPSVWKPDGTELVKLLDRLPLRTFEEITSVYGEPRGNHSHAGIDFKAPEGTPVFSVTGGTVARTDWNTQYNGRCVEISFGGYSELFLHLSEIDDSIVPGAAVQPGDRVGAVGNTGVSSASHLHYQINDPEGYSIDPYLYFTSHRRSLGEEDLQLFNSFVEACRIRMGS